MSDPVDAHVHLWNRATDPQPWIDPESMAAIDRDFDAADLTRMLDATCIGTAVVVQAGKSLGETRRLLTGPAERIAGVVGWIDLTADVPGQLGALDSGRLVGIRHLVHVDPDPGWLDRPDVGRALDLLGARGLCFDLVVRSWQLPLAARVAKAHPGTRFVLDHLGGIAETTDDADWESGLRALAGQPHVYAKISGLAGLVGDPGRLRRIAGVALDAFGPDRLMYGSDWPMARLGAGPVAWRTAVDELIGGLSATERHAIMSGTATACYRLDR
ncbi:amidohydrolase family protein [Catenuloplanes sp. NPDC051500]|uniref:amidohydrolase family protein n=1 Tax=Catenuloplanes sp. NPDC051500 TaxID=3363959 RepID=UPI0037BC0108